jgi:hypothetical protein
MTGSSISVCDALLFTQGWLQPARASVGMKAAHIASTNSAATGPAHRQRNEEIMRIDNPTAGNLT